VEILISIAKAFPEGQGSFSVAFGVGGNGRPAFLFPSPEWMLFRLKDFGILGTKKLERQIIRITQIRR
jgi:hypothetical protein